MFQDVYFHRNDIEELPDLSESIVMGDFDYRWCMKAKSPLRLPFIVGELKEPLKGAPKQVGGAPKQVDEEFACSMIESLTSLEGAPKDEEKRKQQNINKASILHIKKFGNGGNGGM